MDSILQTTKGVAQADVSHTVGTAALLGVLFHLSIRKIEFEFIMYHFMAVSIISFFAMIYAFVEVGEYNIFGALTKALLFASSFNTGLLTSIGIYRLIFHRCRKFPGPLGAKLTRFYAARLSAKDVQYYKEVAKMHEKYGDFVRTGPREISVLRQSAVPLIYGPNSECRKSTWYGQTGNDPKKCSIHMTRDYNDHRLRRRAWDRGFSIKALATYEPRIKGKADLFMSQLRKNAGKPLDVSAWAMFFSFDVMGEVGFGKDFNNLVSGVEHPAIQGVHAHMTMLGIMSTVPWLLNLLSSIPGAAAGYSEFFSFCAGQIREKHKTWDGDKYPQDIVSWLLKAVKDKDVSASPSPAALEDDSRVVIIAGSETTATTLAGILFYLAKYPEKQKKLQRLVDKAMPAGYSDWNYEKVKSVTYIDDFISETLRLRPALLNGGPRETPAQGIRVDEVHIPGKTNVLVPIQLIHRDPRWWQQAEEFVPERFGEKREEMGTEKAPYLPFSLGAYSCPGKNLAQLSLRTSLSSIVQNFDVSFAPGETGVAFDKEVLDTFTVTLPPLQLQFTPRSRN
ncbi:cytochrome P450 [Lindgomyces ingoldianus]|uniref:Cytochrome P450 n=1 Tax=Lindgomyces ingoldianus TaxID=673940 RepID=A0ACB6QUH3_9PLEO|nr:cytochrome P450 [Lindgomyces ingoldianus]KAF2470653.1 cytochrome P450 [Lindgomyces ingoldianus]